MDSRHQQVLEALRAAKAQPVTKLATEQSWRKEGVLSPAQALHGLRREALGSGSKRKASEYDNALQGLQAITGSKRRIHQLPHRQNIEQNTLSLLSSTVTNSNPLKVAVRDSGISAEKLRYGGQMKQDNHDSSSKLVHDSSIKAARQARQATPVPVVYMKDLEPDYSEPLWFPFENEASTRDADVELSRKHSQRSSSRHGIKEKPASRSGASTSNESSLLATLSPLANSSSERFQSRLRPIGRENFPATDKSKSQLFVNYTISKDFTMDIKAEQHCKLIAVQDHQRTLRGSDNKKSGLEGPGQVNKRPEGLAKLRRLELAERMQSEATTKAGTRRKQRQGRPERHPMLAISRRDLVYCCECGDEWYRDEHGLVCPECQSEFTEIIEDGHQGPKLSQNRP